MQFTTALLPVLLSSLGLASADANIGPSETPATWKVSNFSYGCTGDCSWHFNVSGTATQNTPAFDTYCHGHAKANTSLATGDAIFEWPQCELRNISAVIKPEQHPYVGLHVLHAWSYFPAGERRHDQFATQSKNVTAESNGKSFNLNQDAVSGVSKRHH